MRNGKTDSTSTQSTCADNPISSGLCIKSEKDLNQQAFQTIHLPLSPSHMSYALKFRGVHSCEAEVIQENAYGCIQSEHTRPIFKSPTFLSRLITDQVTAYARDKTIALQEQYLEGHDQYHCPGATLSMATQISNDLRQTWLFVTNIGYSNTFLATNAQGRWNVRLLNKVHDVSNEQERKRVIAEGGKIICEATAENQFIYYMVATDDNTGKRQCGHKIKMFLTRSIGNCWIKEEHIKGHRCEPSTTMVAVDGNRKGFLLQVAGGISLTCTQIEALLNQPDFQTHPELWCGLLTQEEYFRSKCMDSSTVLVTPICRAGIVVSSVANGHQLPFKCIKKGNYPVSALAQQVVDEAGEKVMGALSDVALHRDYLLTSIREHDFQVGWCGGVCLVNANKNEVRPSTGSSRRVSHTAAQVYKALTQESSILDQVTTALDVLKKIKEESFLTRVRRSSTTRTFYATLQARLQRLQQQLPAQPSNHPTHASQCKL